MQYAIKEAYNCGYVFHDGYVWYLNEDWNLCCRPLFGKAEEVTIYEGTALAAYFNEDSKPEVDLFESYSCTLTFGKNNFYFRYYTAIDEADAAIHKYMSSYEPIPVEWEDYIGTLPSR